MRDAIIDGRLSQGEQLGEVRIARALGTGRGAVREAIRQLVQEGLAEYRLHRGAFVRVLSARDVIDIYMAREAIEVFAASQILRANKPPDLSRLEQLIEQMRRAAVGLKRPSPALLRVDLGFHREFVSASGCLRLGQAYETLVAETLMALQDQGPYPWKTYVQDHERLLVAAKERDPATPELVQQHLRFSASLISEATRSRGQFMTESRDDAAVDVVWNPLASKAWSLGEEGHHEDV